MTNLIPLVDLKEEIEKQREYNIMLNQILDYVKVKIKKEEMIK